MGESSQQIFQGCFCCRRDEALRTRADILQVDSRATHARTLLPAALASVFCTIWVCSSSSSSLQEQCMFVDFSAMSLASF